VLPDGSRAEGGFGTLTGDPVVRKRAKTLLFLIGSLQEEALFAIVAPGPAPDATSDCGPVEASRAANAPLAGPVTSMTAEQTRVLTAQQALLSPDLGSLQEEALTAIVAASSAEGER
jgi:hypothetical protein